MGSPKERESLRLRYPNKQNEMSSSSSRGSRAKRGKVDSRKLLADPAVEKHKSTSDDLEWVDQIPECLVFHPSTEEFKDPLAYIQSISEEASTFGICKIVSPWKASVPACDVLTKEQSGFEFQAYVQPLRLQQWNEKDKGAFLITAGKHTYKSFKKKANKEFSKRFPKQKPDSLHPTYVEKEYWSTMARGIGEVEYGANVDGTAFSAKSDDQLGQSNANLKTLPLLPQCPFRLLNYNITGVSSPMLYIGMLFSTFAWHIEDHFLYSINYHHFGAPKLWYGVPGNEASELDKVALDHVYSPDVLSAAGPDGAAAKLSEKTTMFPPSLLLKNHVKVFKAVQMPGDYVVTFPRAYHAGFSLGFNIGEAVNFAIRDWFPFGVIAGQKYANINKLVNVPYEELLCKEAIDLSNSLNDDQSPPSTELASHQSPVRSSFVTHFESLANALLQPISLEATFGYAPKSQGTLVCYLCNRDCYLTFLECNRCVRLTCLFHEFESLNCPLDEKTESEDNKPEVDSPKHKCQGQVVVFVREDISDVVNAYKRFVQANISSSREKVLVRLDELQKQASVKSEDSKGGKGKVESFKSCPEDSKRPRSKRGLRKPETQPKFG